MGFYERQWSTIFKGILITSRRERSEAHKAEKYGGAAADLLFVEFPELLEKEHRVTRFMKRAVDFVNDIKKAGKNCFLVLYNELTEDMAEERAVHSILVDDIQKHWQNMPRDPLLRDVEKRMLLAVTQELQKDVGNERKLYRELEAVMNEAAESGKEHQDIMDIARTLFKEKASIGNKIEEVVWKRNISQARREIRDTRKIEHAIKSLIVGIEQAIKAKKGAYVKSNLQQLESELSKVSEDVAAMYRLSYLVKQRAFLLFIKLLYIGEQCEKYVQKEVAVNYAPHSAEEKLFNDFKKAMRELSSDFRTVAQEFRIDIHDTESDIRQAEKLARAA